MDDGETTFEDAALRVTLFADGVGTTFDWLGTMTVEGRVVAVLQTLDDEGLIGFCDYALDEDGIESFTALPDDDRLLAACADEFDRQMAEE